MTASKHCLAALPLAGAVSLASGSVALAAVAAVASVLIDLDHVTDYVLYRRGFHGLADFFESCNEGRLSKLYLVMHAWEWQAALWLLWLTGLAPAVVGMLALGMTWHLVLDQFGNRNIVLPLFYFIAFRASRNFDGDRLYRVPPALARAT